MKNSDNIDKLSTEERRLYFEQLEAENERIAKELVGRKKSRGMDYYVPNPIQEKAHLCEARTILIMAGNRFGKTHWGAMELCWHLTGNYPNWYPKSRRLKQPIKAVISVDRFQKVQTVIEPKLLSLLPQGFYKFKKSPLGYIMRINCANGSFADVLTLEMSDMAYEGADWDFVWEDEPQSKRKREGLVRGLIDRNGLEIITFTPISEPWMKEELVDKADGKKIALFTGSTYDNMFDKDGNAILSKESIERYEATVDEEYKEARLRGVFFTIRGSIYKSFSEVHLVQCDHRNLEVSDCSYHYQYPNPVICVLDPHDRLPHHVIWAYVDRQDDIFVDYEMTVHCELPELARLIKKVEKDRGYKMRRRLIDPNFGRKPAASGSNVSVKQELAKHGVGFYEPSDDIELGHMVVREFLSYDKNKPVTAVNKPKLYFARHRVPSTIKSMRNLQYEEWAGKTKENKNPKEVEKDKENHGADTVRYLCITKPTYSRMTEDSSTYELAQAPY